MIIRSKAPLRLGLAGGGTDVSPYSDLHGGLVLNATINLYAYCTIEETDDGLITLEAADIGQTFSYPATPQLPLDERLDLVKSIYNRVMRDFPREEIPSFKLTTYSDAPPGSGLGSSSTLVVAVLKAFVEWFDLPMGEYDIAHLAFEIERLDMQLSGGKQDQYAATFGGFNFMEFHPEDRVIVNPLRLKRWIVDELEASLVLYFTGVSRSSAAIIDEQRKNTVSRNEKAISAMHNIRQSAVDLKEAVLKGDIVRFANIIQAGWEEKKKMARSISNKDIERVYNLGVENGALAAKVSGAGGGGFMLFVVDPINKVRLVNALKSRNGNVFNFQFSEGGCHGWKIYDKKPAPRTMRAGLEEKVNS